MTETDKALASLIDKINQLTAPLLDAVPEDGVQRGVELAGEVYQMGAVGNLIWPTLALAILGAAVLALFKSFKAAEATEFKNGFWVPCVFSSCIAMAISGIVSAVGVFSYLVNPVYWKAATDPTFAIAAKVLGLL